MPAIAFTQFLLPHGKRREIEVVRPEPIAAMAERMRAGGIRFEIELLRTGSVHLELSAEDPDGDVWILAGAIRPNGPGLDLAVDEVIMRAYAEWQRAEPQ